MKPDPHLDDEIDDLLARAVAASVDVDPADLAGPSPDLGEDAVEDDTPPTRDELRRLTVMFSDLVGSTPLSARLDPEAYRTVLAAYKDTCRRVIEDEFDGHLVHTRGDGMLAVFGYPTAHEEDALRAVKAGLELHRQLAVTSAATRASAGVDLAARVGVHRGLVYVEQDTEELYGFAVNVAARIQEAAAPGSVAISDEVRHLVDRAVLTEPLAVAPMKGVEVAPQLHRVLDERSHPSGAQRWLTPMIGREEALASLRARHDEAAAADAPLALVIAGEAGIGKSRLVRTYLDELPRRLAIIELGASPFHRRQGLHPIREILHDRAGIRRDRTSAVQLAALRDHLAEHGLAHLDSLLAPVVGLGPEAGYRSVEVDPGRLQALVQEAIHELLARWIGTDGGVVWVEDLHWLDAATLGVLDRLITAGPPGLLVVMTSRSEAAPGGQRTSVLRLDPLSPEQCLELARLHDAALPASAAREVVDRSDGIPLFLEELVLSRHEGLHEPVLEPERAEGVPGALYDPLCARLNSLPEGRVVVSAAAAIGRRVDLDLLGLVSGVTTASLDQAVTTLIERRVLEPDDQDSRTVRFRHELVRQVAYELEPPSGRQRLHTMVAQALASGVVDAAVDWSLIAEHHRRGGQPASAAVALERAADDARQRGSLEEARAHFDQALEVLADAAPNEARDRREIALRLHRAFLAVSAEGFGSEHAAADYRTSLALCVERPASEEMYETLIALWGYYINRGDLERAWAVSTALRGLSQGVRAPMLPTNEAGFGMIEWYRGRAVEAARRLEAAVAAIDDVGVDASSAPAAWTMPLDPIASMHIHLALARAWRGDPAGAAEQAAAACARCAALPFPLGPFTLGYVRLTEAVIHVQHGDPEAARARSSEAVAVASEHGFDAWLFWASTIDRGLEALTDESVDAAATAAEMLMSVELWDAIGSRVITGTIQALAIRVLLEAGDLDGALGMAKAALSTAEETGSVALVADAVRLAALAGPEGDRARGLREAHDVAAEQGATLLRVQAAADLVRHLGPDHRPLLAAALSEVSEVADVPVFASARELLGA